MVSTSTTIKVENLEHFTGLGSIQPLRAPRPGSYKSLMGGVRRRAMSGCAGGDIPSNIPIEDGVIPTYTGVGQFLCSEAKYFDKLLLRL